MTSPSIPDDPRIGRQRVLATYLRVCLAIVLVAAVMAVVVPEDQVERTGKVMVGLLILAPIGRVLWLLVRWHRRGDRRFALAAVALLVVMALGYFLA